MLANLCYHKAVKTNSNKDWEALGMQIEDLRKLVDKIQHLQCEMQTIELKAANKGCPTRLYDTLSSFSNQDEGGIIIFGLDEKHDSSYFV